MRALVTGAGGYLGSHLCRHLLAAGWDVVGLGRGHYPLLESWGIDCRQADIRQVEPLTAACGDVEVVFHTAAVAGIWGRRELFETINVTGTLNVIAACRSQGIGRLVFTSSPSVTFDGTDQEGVDESVPYAARWLCDYPRTKALAEQAVLDANGPELATCALRPHLIWGPGDPHLVPRLVARAAAGRLRRIGDGTNLVDTIYVDNAAEAHLQAAEVLQPGSAVAGQAYFLSQGEPVNCWDWIAELLSLHGLKLPARGLSFSQAWALGAGCELWYRLLGRTSDPPMTRFVAAQLAKSHYFDISRARRDFGYRPRISLAAGLDRLANGLSND